MFRTNLVTPSPLAFQIGLNFVRFHVDVIVDFVYCEIIAFSIFFNYNFLIFHTSQTPKNVPHNIFKNKKQSNTRKNLFFFYNDVEPHQISPLDGTPEE